MATHESGVRGLLAAAFGTVRRSALLVSFTAVETVALVVWLAFVREAPVVSADAAAGLSVLVVGLLIEHYLTHRAVNGADARFPLGPAALFSASEAALWVLWLAVAESVGGVGGLVAAAVVLAALLVPQHTVEDNVLRGNGLFASLLDGGTVGFSVVESVGSTLWLAAVLRPRLAEGLLSDLGVVGADPAVVGVAVLAAALLVEHVIGVSFSRRG